MYGQKDAEGNLWQDQEKTESRLNQAVDGAHVVVMFQCEECWMLNLERRLPVAGQDELLLKLIRQANLDAMAGRAETTISEHAAGVRRSVRE